MKRRAALLSLVVSVTFATAQASASTSASLGAAPHDRTQSPSFKSDSVTASSTDPAKPGHLFVVNDVKGLLLTCIAPDLDTNADTDLFKSCVLAPGRSLDDVMHTFVQAIHYEQSQNRKDRDAWMKYLEENASQKPTH